MKLSYPPAVREMLKAISNESPEPPPGITIRMTDDEQYTICNGQYEGMKGNFVRTDDRITGINFMGRQAVKQ